MQFNVQQLVENLRGLLMSAREQRVVPSDFARVLSFVSEVVRVVDDAFTGVDELLVKYASIDDRQLAKHRLPALAAELKELRTRKHFKQAGDICGQLRVLRERYEETIGPIVDQHATHRRDWAGLFGLLEEREGAIVRAIEEAISLLQQALFDYTAEPEFQPYYGSRPSAVGSLNKVRSAAAASLNEIQLMLLQLRTLKNELLAKSGKTGVDELLNTSRFAESPAPVHQHYHGPVVTVTNSNHNVLNVDGQMGDVMNMVEVSDEPAEFKNLVLKLTRDVEKLSLAVDARTAEALKSDVTALGTEIAGAARPEKYKVTLKGLKEAAAAVGDIAQPVLATVTALLAFLG